MEVAALCKADIEWSVKLYPFSFYGLLKHEDRIDPGTIRAGDTLGPRLHNTLLQASLERRERKRETCKIKQISVSR